MAACDSIGAMGIQNLQRIAARTFFLCECTQAQHQCARGKYSHLWTMATVEKQYHHAEHINAQRALRNASRNF